MPATWAWFAAWDTATLAWSRPKPAFVRERAAPRTPSMPCEALDHRDPGVAAYVLDNDSLFAEIICDGIHVDPAMVRLFYKAKGGEKSVLITDGMSATGMPDGHYKLGGLDVVVAEGHCTSGGALAGSVLTMDQAVRNFASFSGAGLTTSLHAAARNPAQLMGLHQDWGHLKEGREANFVALSPDGKLLQSFRRGRPLLG